MCSKAMPRTEMKWWAATATMNEWTNDNMSNNTNQKIVNSIQYPISNNTNLRYTNNFGKERAIIWIETENEAYIFQNKLILKRVTKHSYGYYSSKKGKKQPIMIIILLEIWLLS